MARRSMASRAESEYPTGTEGDATFFTRRILYDDLAVVIRRFPSAPGVPAGGRPFVLVHGLGVSSRYFHPAAAELAKQGSVYLVDLPGYGSAPDPRREVTIVDHAGVLARFLEAEQIRDPVLVGHSMGTQVVSQLVVDFPGVTDRIVLMAPTMDPAARTLAAAATRLLRDILKEPARVKAIVAVDYLIRCGIPYFLRQVPQLLDDRIEERLPRITAKSLVMRGNGDVISPDGWSRVVTNLLMDGTFVTVEGPHIVMFTDPVSVAAEIVRHGRS